MKRSMVMSIAAAVLGMAAGVWGQESPFIPDEANSWAFPREYDVAVKSPIDLRRMNERVAGEHGFIRVSPDGRGFVRGDGEPIRFWAVHASENKPKWTESELNDYCRFLARMGVNLALAGTMLKPQPGQPDITVPSERELDFAWKRVAALKQQGIYSELRGTWFYDGFTQDPGIEGYKAKEHLHGGVIFFEPKLQEAYKSWLRALLTKPNPYTGVPLKDDPAVAMITLFNEDTAFFYTFASLKGGPLRNAQKAFGDWAAEKYGSVEQALAAWKGSSAEGDRPADGRLGFMSWWHATPEGAGPSGIPPRLSDQAEFLAQVQRQYYEQMKRWLKEELGCQQLMMTSNFRPAVPENMMDLENWVKDAGDVIGMNAYPSSMNHEGEKRGWLVAPGHFVRSKSATVDPLSLPHFRRQVAGKPFMITEALWPNPHEYSNEAALLSAIYGGVTGIAATSFAGPRDVAFSGESFYSFEESPNGRPIRKWNCSEPGQLAPFPAAALIARRGYAVQDSPALLERRSFDEMLSFKAPLLPQGADFDPVQDKEQTARQADTSKVTNLAFLTGPVLSKFVAGEDLISPEVRKLKSGEAVHSLNQQVRYDPARRLITLDHPKAQAAVGFLGAAGPIELKDVTIVSSSVHLGVAVVALDDRPLSASRQILVQFAPRSRPTGWKLESATHRDQKTGRASDGWRIVNTGALPFRVEMVSATIQLRNDEVRTVTLLDANGRPMRQVEAERTSTGVRFTAPPESLYIVISADSDS